MQLTVVGCSGSFAGPDSAASCYLVQAPDAAGRVWSVILDLGSGAFGPLQRYIDPRRLDAILITHMHPDHSADVTGADVFLRYHPDGYAGPKLVFAPRETWEIAIPHLGGWDPRGGGPGPAFTAQYWTPGVAVEVGPLRIDAALMNHPVPTYGLRVCGPGRLGGEVAVAYSADTDDCPELKELARDADLLLCEAAFLDGRDTQRGIHLTPTRAGMVATAAGARHLVLTHIQPWTDPNLCRQHAATTYSGPLDVAAPGAVFHL